MSERDHATLMARALSKCSPEPNTGCWLWLGRLYNGYGHCRVGGDKSKKAHRLTYELFKGPIPPGLTIDHLCRVTSCVNPDHLEAVTMRENVLRGTSFAAIAARKTHCPEGHPLSGENLRIFTSKKGRKCRMCVTCKRQRRKEYNARQLARRGAEVVAAAGETKP